MKLLIWFQNPYAHNWDLDIVANKTGNIVQVIFQETQKSNCFDRATVFVDEAGPFAELSVNCIATAPRITTALSDCRNR